MPSILGANSVSGYEVSNSLRFDDGSSTQMNKTISSTSTTWTFSCWIKQNPTDANKYLVSWDMGSGESLGIGIERTSNSTQLFIYTSSTGQAPKLYDGKLRDSSAWMNIVIKNSSGTITSYINGTQAKTSITGTALASGTLRIGSWTGSNFFYDGYMAEVVLIDGTAYSADSFGEFDSDTGIWKPINVSGLTFGSDGFYLEFQQTGTSANASGIGADTSGNDEHFAVANLEAHDVTTDTPTNNFNTLNPLTNDEQTFSEGNTKTVKGGNAGSFATSTFEVNKGKWYFESKLLNYSGDSRPTVGIAQSHNSYRGTLAGAPNNKAYYLLETSYYRSNAGSAVTVNSSPATNDIYMWGVDLDNLKFYIGKNGSWLHSSDPSAGSNGLAIEVADYYSVATSPNDNGTDNTRNNEWLFNFGNPAYTNSSSVSDANGYGDFEYAVPTGFYSYCTKNLADFG